MGHSRSLNLHLLTAKKVEVGLRGCLSHLWVSHLLQAVCQPPASPCNCTLCMPPMCLPAHIVRATPGAADAVFFFHLQLVKHPIWNMMAKTLCLKEGRIPSFTLILSDSALDFCFCLLPVVFFPSFFLFFSFWFVQGTFLSCVNTLFLCCFNSVYSFVFIPLQLRRWPRVKD